MESHVKICAFGCEYLCPNWVYLDIPSNPQTICIFFIISFDPIECRPPSTHMVKFRSSGLSLVQDFARLRDISTKALAGYRWQRKPITDRVDHVRYIIGVDEVSNGALAGPLIVSGCCFTAPVEPTGPLVAVKDSKKLSSKVLPLVADALQKEPSIVLEHIIVHSDEIDRIANIKRAKLMGWVKCIAQLTYKVYAEQLSKLTKDDMLDADRVAAKGVIMKFEDFVDRVAVVVDGEEEPRSMQRAPHPKYMYSVPRADDKFFTVAAASILAKNMVDGLMEGEYQRRFVEYNFKKNKGYATREHREILRQIGPCEIHRRTFIRDLWNSVMEKPSVA